MVFMAPSLLRLRPSIARIRATIKKPVSGHCSPRCSSTLAPRSISALLRHSAHQSNPAGESLALNGFVRSVRKQKRVAFAAVGDGSSLQTVQVVLTPEQAKNLSTGAAVTITGRWTPSPGQKQTHELQAENVRVRGENDAATNPLQKKYQTSEYLRTVPHLRPRLPFNSLLLRLRSQLTASLTTYFVKEDFVQVHPPIITSSDCEGAGEVFTVAPAAASSPAPLAQETLKSQDGEDHFFQTPKYLTVSSQLHLEALAQSVSRVWTLSPTFRAEKSDTPRHLSEFYMLEAEIAFVDDMADVMDVVEGMLRHVATELQSSPLGQELLESQARDLEQNDASTVHTTLAQRWQGLIDGPWPRITYAHAIRVLQEAVHEGKVRFDFAPTHEDGLQTEHERFLAEHLGRGGPVFVTDYPRKIKPFYMAPSADTAVEAQTATPTVACFDLLVPETCELVGGSMREHRLPELLEAMEEHGLQKAIGSEANVDSESPSSDGSLQWYLDLRRYGSVSHGGFGLGFDRLVCYLSGVQNIRDVVSFPRWHKRCDC